MRELAVGVDGMRTATFEDNLSKGIAEISRMVLRTAEDGLPAHHFAPFLRIEKNKASGGIRHIHIPRVRDQVVLRALHEEIVQAAVGRGMDLRVPGVSEAMSRFRAAIESGGEAWILRSDIRSFYDSITRAEAIGLAVELGLSATGIGLLRRLDADARARPPWRAGRSFDIALPGLPQGLSVSSSLSELWASKLDAEAAAKGFAWFRFVDDIAVVCRTAREAEDALDWMLPAMERLGLQASLSKTAIHRMGSGVPWLGFLHFKGEIRLEAPRADRWIQRFAAIRRKAAAALDAAADASARESILAQFHSAIRDEITGKTSSRPGWYALADDHGEWKRIDSSLHALIRSLHRRTGLPAPCASQLPSVHRAIASRRKRLEFSVRSNADQGPCASIPERENQRRPRA